MLTAAGYLSDRVEGLDLGDDDHLGKPFAFAELAARVRALGRRAGRPGPPVLERADLIIQVFLPAAGHARPRGTAQRAAPEGTQDFATQHYL